MVFGLFLTPPQQFPQGWSRLVNLLLEACPNWGNSHTTTVQPKPTLHQ